MRDARAPGWGAPMARWGVERRFFGEVEQIGTALLIRRFTAAGAWGLKQPQAHASVGKNAPASLPKRNLSQVSHGFPCRRPAAAARLLHKEDLSAVGFFFGT